MRPSRVLSQKPPKYPKAKIEKKEVNKSVGDLLPGPEQHLDLFIDQSYN